MNAKTIGWTLVSDQSKKDSLNSERVNSTYLDGHNEPLGDTQKRLEKMETSIHRFQEIYCIKQPR
jgi:hypothetical protein